jgi:hypothetical protein
VSCNADQEGGAIAAIGGAKVVVKRTKFKNNKVGEYLLNYKNNLNVLGQINENIWNNKKTIQLTIRDVIL